MQDKLMDVFDKVTDFVKRHKKLTIGVGVTLLILLVWYTISNFRTYSDYTIKNDVKMEDSDGTAYESFHGNIIKYNSDGAFYVSKNGDLIWNEAFDMSSPSIDICDDYVALYDRGGTNVYIMNSTGRKGSVTTSKPILRACVADNGSVAVLMNQHDASYLEIRDIEGELIASGEMHVENSGIPIDISFSEDGKRLAVSSICFNTGNVQTTLTFYDFGSSGQDKKDNITGNYSFSDMVMPRVEFMSNGNLVAFGDHEIALFNDSSEPKLKKEIFSQGNIDSIFYNDNNFGYIGPETNDKGETVKKMYVYGMSGWKKLDKEISGSYTNVYMLENDDVVISSDKTAEIHRISGIKRFEHTFDNSIIKILPSNSSKDYIFVQNGMVQDVRLR
ncbi:MAG TPA: hypothetical protein DCR12_01185 [Lachnospiraceae bacterium]|nr:hypothetical protein [Lachnospiraceae bacterium]